MGKVADSALQAIGEVIADGMTIAVGGFGLSGVPVDLIDAVRDSGAKDLVIVSNNMGVDGKGLGVLLENNQVGKVIASYVGENKLFASQFLSGELEVDFVPQGTLAERLRAGGAGIAAFYTKTGVGTQVAEGKPVAEFDGELYLQERGITTDLALVRAHLADTEGNLTYRFTARNFNPAVATAGRITFVEAEEIVAAGSIDPNIVVTPGIFVNHIVRASDREKNIEQRTVRPRPGAAATA